MPTLYRYPYRPEGWATDIDLMPAFVQLAVADVERSATWYQRVLGFADVFTMRGADGAPVLAHLRWCTFGDLMLGPARTPVTEPCGAGAMLYFSAEDFDAIAERASAREVAPLDGPANRPWNTREVTFADPDGYRLTFSAPTAEVLARAASGNAESMESVVERLRGVFRK